MADPLRDALSALPNAASSPLALVAYILTIIAWLAIALKVKRNNKVLTNLEKLPKADRLTALELEMGAVRIKAGLTPEQWIRSRIHLYYFLGFAIICLVIVIIFISTIYMLSGGGGEKVPFVNIMLESDNAVVPPMKTGGQSTEELISILKLRAARILEIMDTEKKSALRSRRYFYGFNGEADFLNELEATRKKFIELHEKHIEALKQGQLVVAHEIVQDIHCLLWIRHRKLWYSAYAEPDGRLYSFDPGPLSSYAKAYPGPRPNYNGRLIPELALATWPERVNHKTQEDSESVSTIGGSPPEPQRELTKPTPPSGDPIPDPRGSAREGLKPQGRGIALPVAPLSRSDRPNFNGKWKLKPPPSRGGPISPVGIPLAVSAVSSFVPV